MLGRRTREMLREVGGLPGKKEGRARKRGARKRVGDRLTCGGLGSSVARKNGRARKKGPGKRVGNRLICGGLGGSV
jgi:hypothetical protein